MIASKCIECGRKTDCGQFCADHGGMGIPLRKGTPLDDIVVDAVEKFGDGTAFFDYVDGSLMKPEFYKLLLNEVVAKYGDMMNWHNLPPSIAVSGKWGWAFDLWLKSSINGDVSWPVLVFPGDLRHQQLPDPGFRPRLDEKFVFLDNSIYKGRTRGQIRDFLQKHGSDVVDSWVLYDGSRPPHIDDVNYVYRWHDAS